MIRLFLLAFAALALSIAGPLAAQTKGAPDPKHELKGRALMVALKGGGYTLLFRHMAREPDVMEFPQKIVITDCSTQIPLSKLGRAQATSVGTALRELGIPIGEAIASPFCRTLESARLIAGKAKAENIVAGRKTDDLFETMDFAPLAELLLTPPAPGTNRIIVGHNTAFTETEGGPYQQEGEAAVFRTIEGRRTLIARLRVEDWQTYAFPTARVVAQARSSAPDPLLQHKGRALLTTLRFGGYTLFYAAPAPASTRSSGTPGECSGQAALDSAREAQARALGTALSTVQLKVTDIFADAHCGAQEFARLVTRRTDGIQMLQANASSSIAQLLAKPAPQYALRVVVGASRDFSAIAGLPAPADGETVVLRTTDDGSWVVLARLTPGDWENLPVAPY